MGKYGKEIRGSFEGKAGTVIGSNRSSVAYVPFVVILISFFIPHVTTRRRNKDEATTAQRARHQPSIPVNFRHNLVGSLWATMFEPMKQRCLIISPKLQVHSPRLWFSGLVTYD